MQKIMNDRLIAQLWFSELDGNPFSFHAYYRFKVVAWIKRIKIWLKIRFKPWLIRIEGGSLVSNLSRQIIKWIHAFNKGQFKQDSKQDWAGQDQVLFQNLRDVKNKILEHTHS